MKLALTVMRWTGMALTFGALPALAIAGYVMPTHALESGMTQADAVRLYVSVFLFALFVQSIGWIMADMAETQINKLEA